jgi:3,4-dihydroxy-2-butanone 4-phosphate synthase
MMRLPELREMSAKFGIVLTSVQDIKAYRLETEQRPHQL